MKVATRTDSSSIERSMFEENQNPTFNSKHDNVDYVNEEDEGTEVETVSPSDHVDAIAKRETRIVCGMRLLMVTILVVSTVLLSFYTHEYLDKTEKEAFVDEFESQANKVLQSIGSSLDLTLGTVDAMAVSMISYARDTDQKWPVSWNATHSRSGRQTQSSRQTLQSHSNFLSISFVLYFSL